MEYILFFKISKNKNIVISMYNIYIQKSHFLKIKNIKYI